MFDPRGGKGPEEGTATHSSVIAWRIPWTEEPGRLYSVTERRMKRLSMRTHTDHSDVIREEK